METIVKDDYIYAKISLKDILPTKVFKPLKEATMRNILRIFATKKPKSIHISPDSIKRNDTIFMFDRKTRLMIKLGKRGFIRWMNKNSNISENPSFVSYRWKDFILVTGPFAMKKQDGNVALGGSYGS